MATVRDYPGKVEARLDISLPTFEELKRSIPESQTAFMAMPFGDPLLDRVFEECFKPAVAETGYQLRRIMDEQKAGLIDDQLRVAIRGARFTNAELTDANLGAYWEAGFAEGLGRPVNLQPKVVLG